MRLIPIEAVREGSFLAKSIYDDNGRILLREGVKLTELMIKRIRAIHIYSVYVIDEYSGEIIEDIIKPELRQKAVNAVKETFLSMVKYELASSPRSSTVKLNEYMKEKQIKLKEIQEVAATIVDEVLSQKNILINAVDIKSMDNYTYQHCVNVALLSLIIGVRLQLRRTELHSIFVGALMHDCGKMFIPKEIILKPDKLTTSEFEIIKTHSQRGYDYLKDSYDIGATSRIIALQHHERVDGKGYPNQKKGDEIHKYARITSIADVYDALTSDRPYRRGVSPNEALEYIMGGGGTLFDYQMVEAFSQIVVPYPKGTLVRLSNGDIGVVEATNPIFPLRPCIKIIKSKEFNNISKIVNLAAQLNLVIDGIQYEVS